MSTSFNDFAIDSNIIKALNMEGINTPTEIQALTIPTALENKDIIGQSETGSGKTLAYILPIFNKILTDKKEMQAIILAPTHELVMQINNVIKTLSENSGKSITSATIIGEVNIQRQIEKLKEKPHIIVGSSGRILELIKKKKISAHTIKTIVIDEGDRLLNKNNISTVKDVIKSTMRDRQLMVFSATINNETLNTAKALMKDPEIITIQNKLTTNPNITHLFIGVEKRDKMEVLRKLIASIKPERALIFINRSEEIQVTTLKLQYHHLKAYGIFGSADKEERKKALEGFRSGKYQLLVASDLAARGLDIKDVSHIFNLDLPEDPKEYLHRCGRTGRAGKPGTTISIATEKEKSLLKKFAREFHIEIEEKEIYMGSLVSPRRHKPNDKVSPKSSVKTYESKKTTPKFKEKNYSKKK